MKRLLFTCFILLVAAGANAQLTKDQANARKSDSDVASSQTDTEVSAKVSNRDTRRAARIDARKAKQVKTASVAAGGGASPEKAKSNRGRKYYIDVNGTKTYVDDQD